MADDIVLGERGTLTDIYRETCRIQEMSVNALTVQPLGLKPVLEADFKCDTAQPPKGATLESVQQQNQQAKNFFTTKVLPTLSVSKV